MLVPNFDGFVIGLQRFAGTVSNRPARAFRLGRLAAIVAGAANLGSNAAGKLARVDDGSALLESFGSRQSGMM